MNERNYVIAGLAMRVEGNKLADTLDKLKGFSVFAKNTGAKPICVVTEGSLTPEENEALKENPEHLAGMTEKLYADSSEISSSCFGKTEQGYVLGVTGYEGRTIRMDIDSELQNVRISGDYNEWILNFTLWCAFGLAALRHDVVAIHSSTIAYRNRTVLFLGESGTGKSTHTRLWLKNIDGAKLLNDDSPIVRIEDGKPFVYGSPWSGKGACYVNERYPLAACVRLSQAPHNRITRLSVPASYAALHPSCAPFMAYDDALYDMVSEVISKMVTEVPVYSMEALPDDMAAFTTCNKIYGECRTN